MRPSVWILLTFLLLSPVLAQFQLRLWQRWWGNSALYHRWSQPDRFGFHRLRADLRSTAQL